MKIAIRYQATFQYAETASFSPHLARLFPRRDMGVTVQKAEFSTHHSADVQNRQDLYDNLIARCFFPDPLACLDFRLALDLTLTPKNPFHFLLDSHALELPFSYLPREAEVLAPYAARRTTNLTLPEPIRPSPTPRPTVDALITYNSWLHENITYERRDEGDPMDPAETLSLGRGSCRDYAVLMAEVLRAHGVAARLASGYLWEGQIEEKDRRAENALHAWVEAYLPGAGWVGFDPTNGVLCDHHYLPTAIGLAPDDIAPILGTYYGKKAIASTLETALTIEEITT